METSTTPLPPIPRLRVSRQAHMASYDSFTQPEEPQAGPSRLPDRLSVNLNSDLDDRYDDYDDDKEHSTPRLSASAALDSNFSALTGEETPAARLRALLSRVPNNNSETSVPPHAPPSPSERDSDFDIPNYTGGTPSIAKESLRDIFSRALRDPGDTPQKGKGRWRRNSIDLSEVEGSPRVERVQKARAENSGQRKSLSDDEVEIPHKSSQRSESSFRSSQAATFDILRERLGQSQSQLKSQDTPTHFYAQSTTTPDDSADTATFLRHLNSSQATPPAATSTPQQSLHISTNSQFQSNLMDQDSSMQQALNGFDSYEGVSGPSQLRSAEMSMMQGQKNEDDDSTPVMPSPPQFNDHTNTNRRQSQDRADERTREWSNSHSTVPLPRSDTPETKGSKIRPGISPRNSISWTNVSNGHSNGNLRRTGSSASLRSVDDSFSSRGSVGSQVEYREHISELEKERNREREREWNKRHVNPSLSRQGSSNSIHSQERSRKLSQPPRPDSALSISSSTGRHRHLSLSSRGSSPSSSIHSRDEEKDPIIKEIVHERERNWNAPQPKWNRHGHSFSHERSRSPMPVSPSPTPSSSSTHLVPPLSDKRQRTQSMKASGTPKGEPPIHRESPMTSRSSLSASRSVGRGSSPQAPTPLPQKRPSPSGSQPTRSSLQRPLSYPARPSSPLPPIPKDPSKSSSSLSFSRSQIQQPSPSDRDDSTVRRGYVRAPSSPTPSPGSRSSANGKSTIRQSHIPVRSPSKKGKESTSPNQSRLPIAFPSTPKAVVSNLDMNRDRSPVTSPEPPYEHVLTDTDEEDDLPQESTPTIRTVAPPPVDSPVNTPPTSLSPFPREKSSSISNDESRLQKALASPPSPPPTPPSEEPSPPMPVFDLPATPPPNRSSFANSRIEFQTPSPPKGLPELPGPPSSSSDEELDEEPRQNGHETLLKTPRPPGGWAYTPAPQRHASLARAHSLPPDEDTSYESGLATPVASLSRAASLPPQTPALPGAWMATPFSKKSVRFEPRQFESEQSASEDVQEPSDTFEEPSLPETQREPELLISTPHVNGILKVSTPVKEEHVRVKTPELPSTPVSTSPRSPRRSPSVRVVDAFGRVQSSSEGGVKIAVAETPRSKSSVRIVDAMGREVEELTPVPSPMVEREPSRSEALLQVRRGLSDLAKDIDEVDKASEGGKIDRQHIRKLADLSRNARETRDQLSRTLQMSEADIRSKLGPLRANMKKAKLVFPQMGELPSPYFRRSSWVFWLGLLLQVVLVFVIYRVTTSRARNIFLTTYYDPFYAELHLYTTRPDPIYRSISPWTSVIRSLSSLRHEGMKAFATTLMEDATVLATAWQKNIWEAWGTDAPPHSLWPPT